MHYNVSKSPPLVHILRQFNLAHTLIADSSILHFAHKQLLRILAVGLELNLGRRQLSNPWIVLFMSISVPPDDSSDANIRCVNFLLISQSIFFPFPLIWRLPLLETTALKLVIQTLTYIKDFFIQTDHSDSSKSVLRSSISASSRRPLRWFWPSVILTVWLSC